jgi:hypothetical protein
MTAVEWLYNKLSTCTSDEMVGNINNWFEQARVMEQEQLKNMYLKGIENYDPTFKRKSQWTSVTEKDNQKQHIIDIMKADENDGLYNQNK